MKYAADYNEALKYAKAEGKGIGTFIKAAHGNPVHAENNHDAVLADYLEDAEDPRHLIVRKHLEMSQHPNRSIIGDLEKKGMDPFPVDRTHLDTDSGNLIFDHFHNYDNGQSAVSAAWVVPHPDGFAPRTYRAVLTPAEAHAIHSEFAPKDPNRNTANSLPVDIS